MWFSSNLSESSIDLDDITSWLATLVTLTIFVAGLWTSFFFYYVISELTSALTSRFDSCCVFCETSVVLDCCCCSLVPIQGKSLWQRTLYVGKGPQLGR